MYTTLAGFNGPYAKFLIRAHLFLKRGGWGPNNYSQHVIGMASIMLCSILEHIANFLLAKIKFHSPYISIVTHVRVGNL